MTRNTPRSARRPGGLTGDFRGRSHGFALAGAILLVAGATVAVAQDWFQHRQEGIAGYKAWMTAGPPCPPVPKGILGAPDTSPLQITNFGGVGFGREHGATLCNDVATDHGRGHDLFPVCQFDHPGVIEVSTRRGLYRFWAGFMNPATISVEHDVPACAIGATQDFGHRLIFDAPSS